MRAERKIKWFSAACLVVFLLTPIFRHFQVQWQLRSYRKKLEAGGEKLRIAELSPKILPASTNAAKLLALVQATHSFIDLYPSAMKYVQPGVARVAWRQPVLMQEVDSGKPEVDVWPRLRIALQTNERRISDLTEMLNNRPVQITFDYIQLNSPLGFLPDIKYSSASLGAVAILHLHDGNQQEAYESLLAGGATMHLCSDNPLMIIQLVRYAVEGMTIGPLWEALQSDAWSDNQWSLIQNQWSNLDYVGAAAASLEMERARAPMMFDYARQQWQGLTGISWTSVGVRDAGQIWNDLLLHPGQGITEFYDNYSRNWSWNWIGSYQDERRYLEFMQSIIEAARDAGGRRPILDRLPDRSHVGVLDALFSSPPTNRSDVFQKEMQENEGFVVDALRAQTEAQMVVAAIALKRYYMAHNSYPSALGDVVPQLVQRVPIDFMDGNDLRYRLNSDGTYLLYSVGEDSIDNGGDPAPPASWKGYYTAGFFDGRDWVWPRAATQEEVKAFNERAANKHKGK
jgi:hypothetical protein